MWVILYLRPDGWWSAGTFDSHREANDAAVAHDFGNMKWQIESAKVAMIMLCKEGLEAFLEEIDEEGTEVGSTRTEPNTKRPKEIALEWRMGDVLSTIKSRISKGKPKH